MKRVIVLALGLLLAACTTGHPIYSPTDHPIPLTAQEFSLERIETLIVEAGQARKWTFTREGTGHLSAAQTRQSYSAVVDIFFDQRTYSIKYRSSVGLDAKDGTIHQHYNLWIGNLESDIYKHLARAR